MPERVGKQVVLFPAPFQGHITPMFQLGDILYSRGFSISVIHTCFNSPSRLNHPHFTFHPISDGMSAAETSTDDIISLLVRLNIKCVVPLRECLSQILSKEPILCLITDSLLHFSHTVAHSLSLPRMVLRTSGVCSFVVFHAFPLLRQRGYIPIQDAQFEEPVPELPPLRVKDIPRMRIRDEEKLCEFMASVIKGIKGSSGLIHNSFEELESTDLTKIKKEFSVPFYLIGPFNKQVPTSSSSLLTQDRSSISWLNTQVPKSVLYVSFGSLAALDEAESQEIAFGLANSNQPFLWVVRPDLVHGSNGSDSFPKGFFEKIAGTWKGSAQLVQWAPQQEVLSHPAIGGFWTHSGWNSTMESISEGVPMICLPRFGDQLVNARYVTNVWRIGLGLENGLKRGEIEKAIRRMMVEKEGEMMRERIACLKEKACLCLRDVGSSSKSLKALAEKILSL